MRKVKMETNELQKRGFGNDLGFGKCPAVLVIDMVNAFTNPDLPLGTNLDLEIIAINKLLESARDKSVRVYFTVFSYADQALTNAGLWYHKMRGLDTLRAGTENVKIDPRITVNPEDTIITKNYASAFFGTDLVSRLNYRHIDTLILTGCTTSGCVRATAVDAIQYGYIPVVVEEAVADRLEQAHQQSLMDLQLKYADVKSLDQVLKYLGGTHNEQQII